MVACLFVLCFASWFIGLAFDIQIVDKLPTHPHDIRVGTIVTENGVIKCNL